MTENEYWNTEITDEDINRLADAGERQLDVKRLQDDFLKAMRVFHKTCTSAALDAAVSAGNAYLAAKKKALT